MKEGIIIIGYQGIGKSTLARERKGFIDLESSNFWVNGKRADDWYIPYCNIALHLAEQGYVVFTSSHAVVREYLLSNNSDIKIAVCYPGHDLKDEWIKKLEDRYNNTKLEKDYKAWQNSVDRYDENIRELMDSGFYRIIINKIPYYLEGIVDAFKFVIKAEKFALQQGYIHNEYIIAPPIKKVNKND